MLHGPSTRTAGARAVAVHPGWLSYWRRSYQRSNSADIVRNSVGTGERGLKVHGADMTDMQNTLDHSTQTTL